MDNQKLKDWSFMNRSKYIAKATFAFSIFALSTAVSAKTYKLECDTQVCNALTLAISFVNKHSTFFDFNDGDLFVVYDNSVAVDSVAYALSLIHI